jgi:hypothetical protein
MMRTNIVDAKNKKKKKKNKKKKKKKKNQLDCIVTLRQVIVYNKKKLC